MGNEFSSPSFCEAPDDKLSQRPGHRAPTSSWQWFPAEELTWPREEMGRTGRATCGQSTIYLSICLSVCLSVCLSICLSGVVFWMFLPWFRWWWFQVEWNGLMFLDVFGKIAWTPICRPPQEFSGLNTLQFQTLSTAQELYHCHFDHCHRPKKSIGNKNAAPRWKWNPMDPHGTSWAPMESIPKRASSVTSPKATQLSAPTPDRPNAGKAYGAVKYSGWKIGFGWFWALPTMGYQSDGGPQRYVPESLQSLLGAPTRVIIKQVALSIIQDEVVPRKSAGWRWDHVGSSRHI